MARYPAKRSRQQHVRQAIESAAKNLLADVPRDFTLRII